ncbi:hypothetical protein PQR02_39825 [Paraburkholderia sediminicola]|uniref:Uncharacterized protein n=1 Tax=Paraburkholderia rhynchosiae TaxID=487049 RepID=A0ACC7NPL4_9BURK
MRTVHRFRVALGRHTEPFAKAEQNLIANVISLRSQDNTTLTAGSRKTAAERSQHPAGQLDRGSISGVGLILPIPTNSVHALDPKKRRIAPAFVLPTSEGHWLYGALVNNIGRPPGSTDVTRFGSGGSMKKTHR